MPFIETVEKDFIMDVESVLEYKTNIIDDSIKIEKEFCFESNDEVFCHVYTDHENNINRLFLI